MSCTVVTYAYAYVRGQVDLCAEHADDPPTWLPVLGPVQHGAHEGECAICSQVEPDFDDVLEGLEPGVYTARYLNPPGGDDCTHLLVRSNGSLGWCDRHGDQIEDDRGQVSTFTAAELADPS